MNRFSNLLALICVWMVVSCDDAQDKALKSMAQRGYSLSVSEFHRAARMGDAAVVNQFIAAGLAVDVKDAKGISALASAAKAGNVATVEVLLKMAAKTEPLDDLLAAAVDSGNAKVLRLLLDHTSAQQHHFAGVLVHAVRLKHREMVEALLPVCPAEVNTALLTAAEVGDVGIADMLLHGGASLLYADDTRRRTALMQAAAAGHRPMVEFLLRSGSNRFALDSNGKSAADIVAESGGNAALLKSLLVELTADELRVGAVWAGWANLREVVDTSVGLPEVVTSRPQVVAATAALPQDKTLRNQKIRRLHGEIIGGDALSPMSSGDPTKLLVWRGFHEAMLPCLMESASAEGVELRRLDVPAVQKVALGTALPGLPWTLLSVHETAPPLSAAFPSWWWPSAILKHETTGQLALLLLHVPTRVGELCAVLEVVGDGAQFEAVVGDVFATASQVSTQRRDYVVEHVSANRVTLRSHDATAQLWTITP